MPPSPALRFSPGREHRIENALERGHSFKSKMTTKDKDDDLALFNDMQTKEKESFLLHIADDFDDSLCNVDSSFLNLYVFVLCKADSLRFLLPFLLSFFAYQLN